MENITNLDIFDRAMEICKHTTGTIHIDEVTNIYLYLRKLIEEPDNFIEERRNKTK